MLEEEVKNIWNNSAQPAHIAIETSQLTKELNAKMTGIQKVIRVRDRREIVASLIGMAIFTYLLYEIPFPITKAACALSISWFAFVIFKLKKPTSQNTACPLGLSVKAQLAHHKDAMQYQADLLNTVAYWYAIPPFVTNCVFLLGLGNPTDYNWTNSLAESMLPMMSSAKISTIIGLTCFYGFVIWINKRAANNIFEPILENINTIQSQLKTGDKNTD
jgi:hypothetical protein